MYTANYSNAERESKHFYRFVQVSPFQIEAQLLTHPSVKEVAVVGLPHEEDGQHPMAFVVRKDGIVHQSVTAEELIAYASGELQSVLLPIA